MKKYFSTKKARINALMVAAVFAAGIVAYFANGEEPMSDVALANIEALADNENNPVVCLNILSPCENGLYGPYMTYVNE